MAAYDPMTLTQTDLSKYRRLWWQIEDRYILEQQTNSICDGLIGVSRNHEDTGSDYDGDSDNDYDEFEERLSKPIDWDAIKRRREENPSPPRVPGDDFQGSAYDTADIMLEDGEWKLSEEDFPGYVAKEKGVTSAPEGSEVSLFRTET